MGSLIICLKKLIKYVIFSCLLVFSLQLRAQDTIKASDLVDLSFEQLMQLQIKTGTLTGIERYKTPSSITVITKEDIKNTPARNLLDLLEVYVPGGTYVNHWLGARIGMRGVISDQNNSFLLVVDGENMNLQYDKGAFFEINNRDLSEIEKIEIIRGPGSVTYGPGAIGGIISITTKEVNESEKFDIGIDYNPTYRYSLINTSCSVKNKNFKIYMSGSVGSSKGLENPKYYYIDRAHGYGYGYMSPTWGYKGTGSEAPNFMADFFKKPEIKAQINIEFFKDFKFKARYTNFSFVKQQQQRNSLEGPAFPGYYGKQFTSTLCNDHKFSDNLNLKTNIGFQSNTIGDIQLYQGDQKEFDDITQWNNSFSENKINIRSILSYNLLDKLKIAIGAENNYWFYGNEWGKKDNTFLMNFASPVLFAVKDSNAGFYQQYNPNGIVTLIEEPITANQISSFYEINYMPIEKTTLLISGRLDKHNMSKLAFSPRFAVIQELNNTSFLKFIAQQSVRLPNFRELYAQDYISELAPNPEKLKSIELLYSSVLWHDLSLNLSTYYQEVDQIGWTENDKSEVIGEFSSAGIEAELAYKINNLNLSLNYSFVKQLKWIPEHEIYTYLSNIGIDSINIQLTEAGDNRMNNLPQHQLKFISSYRINDSFYLHFNARFASKYGQLEMLETYKYVHDTYGSIVTQEEMTDIYNELLEKGYSKPSFTSNFSASYTFELKDVDIMFSAWVMNLFEVNHIRYVYQFWDIGNARQYPRHIGFVEEPITFGISLKANL